MTQHEITERIDPLHRHALCSCGWSFRVTRRGLNARAAVAKLRGAINRHLEGRS